MPFPFIPIALGLVAVGSAIFGGVKAVEASSDSDEADNTNERAQDVFDAAKQNSNAKENDAPENWMNSVI